MKTEFDAIDLDDYLRIDGSNSMGADLDMGGFSIGSVEVALKGSFLKNVFDEFFPFASAGKVFFGDN